MWTVACDGRGRRGHGMPAFGRQQAKASSFINGGFLTFKLQQALLSTNRGRKSAQRCVFPLADVSTQNTSLGGRCTPKRYAWSSLAVPIERILRAWSSDEGDRVAVILCTVNGSVFAHIHDVCGAIF